MDKFKEIDRLYSLGMSFGQIGKKVKLSRQRCETILKSQPRTPRVTITDIAYEEEDKELTAIIRVDGRIKETIDILGDMLDTEEERRDALLSEAERMGYAGGIIK